MATHGAGVNHQRAAGIRAIAPPPRSPSVPAAHYSAAARYVLQGRIACHPIGPTIERDHRPRAKRSGARISSAVPVQVVEYPSATALLAECSAMHGYRDPVRHRTIQSMKPRNPSGIKYCDEAEPVWTRPNRSSGDHRRDEDAEVTAADRHPHLAQRAE